jgi:hypothetical protein
MLAALAGLGYAIAFVVLRNAGLSALALMLGGLFSAVALVGLHERVQWTNASAARLAVFAALAGAFGAAVHGGYDLAVALHPPTLGSAADPAALSAIDPRGLLTFAVAGGGIALFSWLIARTADLPRGLAMLGYLSALLSVALYLGRLIILTPTSPIVLGPALVEGFLVNPAWYLWLGIALANGPSSAGVPLPAAFKYSNDVESATRSLRP